MKVELNYGRGVKPVICEPDWDVCVIRKPEMDITASPDVLIKQAMDAPLGAAPPERMVSASKTVCILVCDITRPVPNHLFLQPLIRRLIAGGIGPDDITILIATGLHRPNLGEELAELIGDPWVLENIRIVNHDATNDDDHSFIGRTESGTVVRLDQRFVEADLKIATGLVEPHFMAGYSGGRKVVAPGIAHQETITTFHSARFMEHPLAANCVLDGNPLHKEQLEIVEMLGPIYALNTVIDERRRLSFASFGEIIQSHMAAVQYVRQFAELAVDRRFKTVVTSSAGYPLDKTYYQTVKGMVGPLDILDEGGRLIIASECEEGMGSAHFAEAQARLLDLGAPQFLEGLLNKTHASVDEWQTEMQLKPMRRGTVQLFSDGLKGADRDLTGVQMIDSIEHAIAESIAACGDAAVAFVPEGPYVVPFYRAAAAE